MEQYTAWSERGKRFMEGAAERRTEKRLRGGREDARKNGRGHPNMT